MAKKIPLTRDDFIIMQLREIREDIRDMRGEIQDVRNKFNDRMDNVKSESSTARHNQIVAGSVIAIALGVLYFVFTH